MGIGGSIFLIALGAILAFAVHVETGWLNLSVVGWVLMLAGLVGLVMTTYLWRNRRRTVVAPVVDPRSPAREEQVVEEYHEVRRPGRPL
ncbi:DUF6458 family protein [Plantactinospora sp. WMMB334]|uniref:DUF6458 family protein n=1 Tax=Plantactinospora sp. WMMB334 TaxID=3404119 RepID=UPI003B958D21